MGKNKEIIGIKIKLASPERIRELSSGEVKKPETINYRTLKPERDGLFCERIFGPTKSYECYCGKYKKGRVKFEGIICDRCGVEVTDSRVRRERMGHIELAAPVVHIWFLKGMPNRISLLLDVPTKELERVVYFASNRRRETVYKVVVEGKRNDLVKRGDLVTASEKRIHEHYDHKFKAEEAYRVISVDDIPLEEGDVISAEQVSRYKAKYGSDKFRVEPCYRITAIPEDDSIEFKVGDIISQSQLDKLVAEFGDQIKAERVLVGNKEGFVVTAVVHIPFKKDDIISISEYQLYYTKYPGRFQVQPEFKTIEDPCYAVINPSDSPFKMGEVILDREYRLCKAFDKDFEAGIGAEAVKELLKRLNLDDIAAELREQISESTGQKRRKLIKRLQVVEEFRRSESKPEWMVLEVLPVIPPDLRPMVQLDGGRFATSDLNDLYRRVINRNNRLKKLLELRAPDIVIKNEKRMLQEAVDALIDNGRRGRPVMAGNRPLKSLTDLLRGKKGRFRQNLLGKRVDYSGRSVIVVGPYLKHYQCGLPKMMALELFKPFIINRLIEKGYVQAPKAARRMIERRREEVWEVLEEVIKDHPVLLNRAPTLHRLSIQAFEPVLVEGKAIQITPLVCSAFNADFDGDQMAVHVPLSIEAQAESRFIMLSAYNLLSPANGKPIVTPTQDMVIGLNYLTMQREGLKGEGLVFADEEDVLAALDHGLVHVNARIKFRLNGGFIETTPGRVLFNSVLPPELRFVNKELGKKDLAEILDKAYDLVGPTKMIDMLDKFKELGFEWATISGLSLGIKDVSIPPEKEKIVKESLEKEKKLIEQYKKGLITEEEYLRQKDMIWSTAGRKIADKVVEHMDKMNPLRRMVGSGARGNKTQVAQMAGIRGLMADPSGRIIDYPILSNFREGMNMLEYFISTHGARKGLADTALRTAKSGYLTRRLVDVAQDIIVTQDDCGTDEGIWMSAFKKGDETIIPLSERIYGRYLLKDVVDPKTGEVIAKSGQLIDKETAEKIEKVGIEKVYIRSPLKCKLRYGICKKCYGLNLAIRKEVDIGEAVGIVAAQSIGEPGTQLTMRTFHTGGVRLTGEDITQGLPRIEQLFEVRKPKKCAVISEVDGVVKEIKELEGKRRIVIQSDEDPSDERSYTSPTALGVLVEVGEHVKKGQQLTEGYIDPQQLLDVMGLEEVQKYLLNGIQEVYRAQGVTINDRHIEVILRKVAPINRVKITDEGDSIFIAGELVWIDDLNEEVQRIEQENKAFSEFNVKVLSGKKLIDIKGQDISEVSMYVGEVLTEEAIKKILEPGSLVTELVVEDNGEKIKVVVGKASFRKEIENLELFEPIKDDTDKEIIPAGTKLTNAVLSKIVKENLVPVVVKNIEILEELQETAYLAEDVVNPETGEVIAEKDKIITPEVAELIAVSDVSSIKVWKNPEVIKVSDLVEKYLIDTVWGRSLGKVFDAEGNEVSNVGVMVDGRVVRAFAEGEFSVIEVEGEPFTREKVLDKVLTDAVYGKVLLQDVLDSNGNIVVSSGVEINRDILNKIIEANPEELVVRSIYAGTETYNLIEKITFILRLWKQPEWKAVVYGITKAALNTDSFLSAASFQQTAQVLARAAVRSEYDPLRGLKENVIIGRLIPAGTGVNVYRKAKVEVVDEDVSLEEKHDQSQQV